MIEAGDPSVSASVAAAIKHISAENLNAEIVAHSIASKQAIDLVRESGADRVAVFFATSKIHLDRKLHKRSRKLLILSPSMWPTHAAWG